MVETHGQATRREPGIAREALRFAHPMLAEHTWPHCKISGYRPGPRLCISAGMHVNEVSSIEAAIRLQRAFDPQRLRGSVSIIPVLNQPARFHHCEYVCPVDGLNINFSFPGDPNGSFSQVLCHSVINEWAAGADCHVDMHGGDLRENVSRFTIYQRTDDDGFDARARALAMCFDAEIVVGLPPTHLQNVGRAPTGFARFGRFSVMSEAGSNGLLDEGAIEYHVQGVLNVARHLGMIDNPIVPFQQSRVPCNDYIWVMAPADGEFHADAEPGQRVVKGQRLGRMRDLFGDTLADVVAPVEGMLLWRMTHPTLQKGSAALAIGVEERR